MDIIIILLILVVIAQLAFVKQSPRVGKSGSSSKVRPVFIDTSVLMDGRIVTAASTGFIPAKIIIPKSVIAELQLLADTADSDKRSRARHGLDVAAELQNSASTTVEVLDDGETDNSGVDGRLVELAKKHNGAICTIDFNLNKVAKVEGVFTLNINELAQSLRMAFLPGERLSLKLVQKGQDRHQAVGYLADGTMVVVEQAAKQIGEQVDIEFIRSLQTAAGRMMFAKKVDAGDSSERKSAPSTKQKLATKQPTGRGRRRTPEDSLVELANNEE